MPVERVSNTTHVARLTLGELDYLSVALERQSSGGSDEDDQCKRGLHDRPIGPRVLLV
jgi:hypothetical protein